jgi:putative resolvase
MHKLSKICKELDISRPTMYNWEKKGIVKFHKIGSINFISDEDRNKLLNIKPIKKEERNVIYCRVSSTVNKSNLETQKERMINYANAKGYKVQEVITEFGSGINDKRPKLEKLLKEQNFTKLIIEHKDRLTRLGFNYIETLLKKNDIEIEVVNNVDTDEEDIIQDFVSIITSFTARIYGKRRSKRKTELLIKELKEVDD